MDWENEYIRWIEYSIYQFSELPIASWVFEPEWFDIITKKLKSIQKETRQSLTTIENVRQLPV